MRNRNANVQLNSLNHICNIDYDSEIQEDLSFTDGNLINRQFALNGFVVGVLSNQTNQRLSYGNVGNQLQINSQAPRQSTNVISNRAPIRSEVDTARFVSFSMF
jgi:hypothetical protein